MWASRSEARSALWTAPLMIGGSYRPTVRNGASSDQRSSTWSGSGSGTRPAVAYPSAAGRATQYE